MEADLIALELSEEFEHRLKQLRREIVKAHLEPSLYGDVISMGVIR